MASEQASKVTVPATPPASACSTPPPGPNQIWMRQLAAELHLETAFAQPLPKGADADWALRWFTATAESNLCGHATLATAHALHSDRGTPGTIRFASRFGVLIARTRHDATITLDFPAAPSTQAPAPDPRPPRRSARRHAPGHLPHRRPRRPARRPGRRGHRPRPDPRPGPRPGRPGPPDPPRRHPRRHRHRPSGRSGPRLRLRLPLLRIRRWHPRGPGHRQRPPPWRPTGRTAWAATASPGCRPPPAAAWSAPPSTATASTSPATPSPSSTAPCTTTPDNARHSEAARPSAPGARSGRSG